MLCEIGRSFLNLLKILTLKFLQYVCLNNSVVNHLIKISHDFAQNPWNSYIFATFLFNKNTLCNKWISMTFEINAWKDFDNN